MSECIKKEFIIMIHWRLMIGGLLVAGLIGCGQTTNSNDGEAEESVVTILPTEEVEVVTETLRTQNFELEVVSNGRISAQQIAQLRFANTSGGTCHKIIDEERTDR